MSPAPSLSSTTPLTLNPDAVSGTRIANQQIYQSLQDTNFCFRRLNATHESGCQCKHGTDLLSAMSDF